MNMPETALLFSVRPYIVQGSIFPQRHGVKVMAKLFRSGLVTAGATFLSRILGLVRDIFIAHLLGAGLCADVFFFANRIPNFLRRLFAEGAFSSAFVPIMTEFQEQKTEEEQKELLSCTVGTLGIIVFLVTVLGMAGSAIITAVFGWGWFWEWYTGGPEAAKFVQASFLLKITFPYLFFITLTAVSGAVLNTLGRFLVPAVTPCFLNLALIACCVFLAPEVEDPNTALAVGVLVGGIVQFLFQFPFLCRLGRLVWPKWGWNHEGVRRIRTLMIPALFGVSVSQLNLLVNTMLASFLATGAISYLYYSDRLLEFPIGIFAVAISTVILPALSRVQVNNDADGFRKTMDWGVKLVLTLGIPAMMGMIALREPILRVLFMRGEYGVSAAEHSSYSLIASVSGLWAIMLSRVLIPAYNARKDTKTPVKYGIVSMISNLCFNLILVWPIEHFWGYGYIGLALSTSLAAFVNSFLLIRGLRRGNIYSLTRPVILYIVKVVIGAVLMFAAVTFLKLQVAGDVSGWAELPLWQAFMFLSLLIIAGGLCYGAVLLILGVRPRELRG